jgi:hypothetical protein
MLDNAHLLDDKAIRQFITDGFVQVQSGLPARFHQDLCERLDAVFPDGANPGNNILPLVPELQQLYDAPPVRGALQSLLGPGYLMHPHRHCHRRPPGLASQTWHKDDHMFDSNVRHHRCRWLMAFYYPQDVTHDMGPTGILPGSQFHNQISCPDPEHTTESAHAVCGEAGSVTLVNYDIWHLGMTNTSSRNRLMLKFLFMRMTEPVAPAWQNEDEAFQPLPHDPHPALSESVWQWLRGDAGPATVSAGAGADTALAALRAPAEGPRLDAAYALAAQGIAAAPALLDALREESCTIGETFEEPTPANYQGANPADLYAAQGLAAIGAPAVPLLIETLKDDDAYVRATAADILGNIGTPARTAVQALTEAMADDALWVRRNAAEALGVIAASGPAAVGALERALGDDDPRVCLNATLALARLGPAASAAVPALISALDTTERYTRYCAGEALRRIGTPAANRALLDHLIMSRWCPLTSTASPY